MGSHDIQEFCLKWNNHYSTFVSVLDSLLAKEKLVDVVLAAEGQSIKVHRLVLYACSQYFTDLLSQTEKDAVVFLKDVSFSDLKALVDFMYRGEVNISQYQLESFLQTAESLQIKGLADKSNQRKYMSTFGQKNKETLNEDSTTNESQPACPPRRQKTAAKKTLLPKIVSEVVHEPVEMDGENHEEEFTNLINKEEDEEASSGGNSLSGSASESCGAAASTHETGNETWTSENGAGAASETNYDLTMSDSSQFGVDGERNDADQLVILEDNDGSERPFSCPRCSRRYKRKNNAVAHLRYECGVVPSFPCPICSHMLSQRRYIQKHIRRKHPGYIQDYQEHHNHKSRTSFDDGD